MVVFVVVLVGVVLVVCAGGKWPGGRSNFATCNKRSLTSVSRGTLGSS